MIEHSIDATAARSFVQGGFQFGKLLSSACGHDFHVPRIRVFDPSAQADLRSFLVYKPAKADALYAPFDQKVLHVKCLVHPISLASLSGLRNAQTGASRTAQHGPFNAL